MLTFFFFLLQAQSLCANQHPATNTAKPFSRRPYPLLKAVSTFCRQGQTVTYKRADRPRKRIEKASTCLRRLWETVVWCGNPQGTQVWTNTKQSPYCKGSDGCSVCCSQTQCCRTVQPRLGIILVKIHPDPPPQITIYSKLFQQDIEDMEWDTVLWSVVLLVPLSTV